MNISSKETCKLITNVLTNEEQPDAAISVVFVNDAKIHELNKRFLHHDYVTDVISFPMSEESSIQLEGEVYVNVNQAKRQAREYGVRMMNEIGRLIVHGVLHLLGYNDATQRERKRMNALENYYLQNYGVDYFHA